MRLSEVGWPTEAEGEIGYQLHQGARLLQENKRPDWIENVNYIWLTFGVWLVLSCLTEVARRASERLKLASHKTASQQQDATKRLEAVGERLADIEAPREVVDRCLGDAIFGMKSAVLSEKIRAGYLDVVSRFAAQEARARTALAELISDTTASPSLRRDTIHHILDVGIIDDSIEKALVSTTDDRPTSLAQYAKGALEKLRNQEHQKREHPPQTVESAPRSAGLHP
jgi:hypothetical protein